MSARFIFSRNGFSDSFPFCFRHLREEEGLQAQSSQSRALGRAVCRNQVFVCAVSMLVSCLKVMMLLGC